MTIRNLCQAFILLWLSQTFAWAGDDSQTASAIRDIAVGYEHGRGVKQNYREAYNLYCKAALMGDADAAYSMGFMYFNGRGVPRNLSLALHWFKRAAAGGDLHAQQMMVRFEQVAIVEDVSCQPEKVLPTLKLVADDNPNRKVIASWVEQIAPYYGIDPNLVMAVIKAESAFKINAMSNKNAQGLMQLIPATAERFGVKDTWDPIQNIKGGTAYLHWLLRHFQGKVDLVLAAYNAGEGAVERYHGIPPFQETQNYVKQILSWYDKLQHPIPPEQPAKKPIQTG